MTGRQSDDKIKTARPIPAGEEIISLKSDKIINKKVKVKKYEQVCQ
jgi:hypothetical protein